MMHTFSIHINERIHCTDCDVDLTERTDWEPVFRLDTTTGDTVHGRQCYACIADIERIRAEDLAVSLAVVGAHARYLRASAALSIHELHVQGVTVGAFVLACDSIECDE